MTKRQKQIREEILAREWENYKAEITLKELVEVLNSLTLINAYRIMRKRSENKQ